MPKVFLSFATEDLDFVLRLFTRFKQLGIEVWDYSNRDEEVRWGEKIKPIVSQRILESDYFMPVISINSIDSEKEIIQFEVRFALQNAKTFYPIMIATRQPPGRPKDWKGAFSLLSEYKCLLMDHTKTSDFEAKIALICDYLKIPYLPETRDHALLPLYEKLMQEIQAASQEFQVFQQKSLSEQLMKTVSRFNTAYMAGDWHKSLQTITRFLSIQTEELEIDVLYYPLIVKGACELQLNLLEAAENTFGEATRHSKADENAYGGLGQVYIRRRNWKDALTQFNLALAKCPPGLEVEILYNTLMIAVEILSNSNNDDPILKGHALQIINSPAYIPKLQAQVFASPKDTIRTNFLIGLAYFKSGRLKMAGPCFSGIIDQESFRLSGPELVKDIEKGFVTPLFQSVARQKGFFIPIGLPIQSSLRQNGYPGNQHTCVITDDESLYLLTTTTNTISIRYCQIAMIAIYADWLNAVHEATKARELLYREAETFNNRMLFHFFAHTLAVAGLSRQSLEIYKTKLITEPYDRRYLVEYALLSKAARNRAIVIEICTKEKQCGSPEKEDYCGYYYHGFAFYLLGKLEVAREFYDESKCYDVYYPEITDPGPG
jgi:tetratricopeptide (TPR) repeat protein